MRPLLLVEDDPLARQTLVRSLTPTGKVLCAEDVEGALAILRAHEVAGVVADLGLGGRKDGGFEVLDAAAVLAPGVPLLVVTGSREPWATNGAAVRGADLVAKPDYNVEALRPFLDRVAARDAGVDQLSAVITGAAILWKLTPRERQLLPWLVAAKRGAEICAAAGYRSATYKTHVKALLAKSACRNTAEVVIALYKMATGTQRREHVP